MTHLFANNFYRCLNCVRVTAKANTGALVLEKYRRHKVNKK